MRDQIIPPSRQGGLGSPLRKFLNFERFYVRIKGVLCVLDQISVILVTIFY